MMIQTAYGIKTCNDKHYKSVVQILLFVLEFDHVIMVLHCIWMQMEYIDGLVQERCNSIANTLELRLSCTKPSIC